MASGRSADPAVPIDLVELGHVMSAFGVQGWVKIYPYGDDPTILTAAKQWWLSPRSTSRSTDPTFRSYRICQARRHSDTVIALLEGFSDRDQAQGLRGHTVWLPRSAFPAPEPDEYYWVDLIGCWVYGLKESAHKEEKKALIGRVSHVFDNGAHAVLVVDQGQRTAEGDFTPALDKRGRPVQILVPFVQAHLSQVDLSQQRIETTWPIDF